ncbi:MAG: hypothetical protein Tsb0017_12150 [Geothermobacteraceae bacterium]
MRHSASLFFMACFLLLTLPLPALALDGTCAVQFFGSSTLHDFEGTGRCAPFSIVIGPGHKVDDIRIAVPVAGMDTANKRRNKKMREMFEADRYPDITGHLAGNRLETLVGRLHRAAGTEADFPFELIIRDRARQVQAKVTELVDDASHLAFTLSFPVSLKDFELKPPSVLGFIRVADQVRVEVRFDINPLPRTTGTADQEPSS